MKQMRSLEPRSLQPLLTTLGVLLSLAHVAADEPVRLRVLSYNIHHAEGVDRKLDLERIAQVIRTVDPDLVALQEVDQKATRTGSVDQPSELARLTKRNVIFGANISLQGGHYGNAVLSRFLITRHENHLLPNIDNGEQRGVIVAEVKIPQLNEPLLLLATHLDHRRNDRERIASAKAINKLVTEEPLRPALLAGDLNDVVESETLSVLGSTWTPVNSKPLPTIPVAAPIRQIDFVMFRPQDRWRVVAVKVLDEAVASDHRAILEHWRRYGGRIIDDGRVAVSSLSSTQLLARMLMTNRKRRMVCHSPFGHFVPHREAQEDFRWNALHSQGRVVPKAKPIVEGWLTN